MHHLEINSYLIHSYHSFLINRQQLVSGVPQGCVSSPSLFTIYTNNCVTHDHYLIKYSDDTVLVALMEEQQQKLCSDSVEQVVQTERPHSEPHKN